MAVNATVPHHAGEVGHVLVLEGVHLDQARVSFERLGELVCWLSEIDPAP